MEGILIIMALFCLMLLIKRLGRRSKKQQRHKQKRSSAKRVIKRLQGFTGDYRSAAQLSYLRKIDPYVFEELLLYRFATKGYKAIHNHSYSNDGGIDGRLVDPDGKLILLQAKRYSSHINVSHLEQFALQVKDHPKAERGFFIHTGRTGSNCYDILSRYKNIELISGKRLIELLKD